MKLTVSEKRRRARYKRLMLEMLEHKRMVIELSKNIQKLENKLSKTKINSALKRMSSQELRAIVKKINIEYLGRD